ncbi:MAG: aminomethyl-transferring glycine dehydrogenase subunit GcvPA [Firmicutes bacterium]|nr:aminomethyl-transferring glycine dehydrogenase subunit GcvPA [Bacillota bacterium]
MRYIPMTEHDRQAMLASMGISSVDELFADIPEPLRSAGDLNLPPALSEAELVRHMKALARKNVNLEECVSFMGGGAYDHLIPAVIKHLISRGEFLTAYTPYQAEISQGVLQSIFEYQTLIAELTGMEAANASMYDGATALAEAALMACGATRRNVVVLPENLHPEWREVCELYLKNQDVEIQYVPYDEETGTIDHAALQRLNSASLACVVVQQPNFFGLVEDVEPISDFIHQAGGLLVMAVDPISLAILKSPGEYGADIVVGDGQSLGNSMSFGGPSLGFFATTAKLVRRMPGRIVGETVDGDGRRGFVLTLQTREQHIRREKATSNICSNQALNALAAAIYLSLLGKQGFKEVAYHCLQKTAYLRSRLLEMTPFRLKFTAPAFREVVVAGEVDWENINQRLLKEGFLGGLPLKRYGMPDAALFAVTEARTKAEIDRLVELLGGMS